MRRAPWCLWLLFAAACTSDGQVDPAGPPTSEQPFAAPEVRPDTPGNNLQFNFERADLVETFGSSDGRFLVHFTRNGQNAVPAADDDASSIPDFVEEVASVYVDVLAYYESLGFRAPESDDDVPDNGGDDRFDVYLVDFAGIGDGAFRQDSCLAESSERCIGFMTQENDYVGYGYPSTLVANRILGSHEFFHAVQAAYDVNQGSVLSEGTAVWATEAFDPSLNDFEAFIDGYLENPDRPLDQPLPGPVDPFSYGSAIFFQFLAERYDPDAIRLLWERCENGGEGGADPLWMSQIDAVAAEVGAESFAEAMVEFATWNLHTDEFADPDVAYANGEDFDRVKMEAVEAPYVDDEARLFYAATSYFSMMSGGRAEMTAALVASADDPTSTEAIEILLVSENGSNLTVKRVADVTSGSETLSTGGVDHFVVAIVNTATSGDSKKPGLCIGSIEEVADCKLALASGAGGAGGAGGGDPGEGGAGGAGASDSDDGCGCRIEPSAPSVSGCLLLLALCLFRGRRRCEG